VVGGALRRRCVGVLEHIGCLLGGRLHLFVGFLRLRDALLGDFAEGGGDFHFGNLEVGQFEFARTCPGAGPCLMDSGSVAAVLKTANATAVWSNDIVSLLVQCNRNIAPHNKSRSDQLFFRRNADLAPSAQRGGSGSFVALLVLSPRSLACSVSACICRRM